MRMASWRRPSPSARRHAIVSVLILLGAVFVLAGTAPWESTPWKPTPTASVVAASSAAAGGGVGIRLLDARQDQTGDQRAQVYIVDNLVPGQVMTRHIEVSNTTAAPVSVALYPDAADITGGAFVGAAGQRLNELAAWTTLSAASLEIPAEGTARDTVTIRVPGDAGPSERYAVIWAEIHSSPGAINVVNRVGIRMYVWVGGDNPPPSNFTVDTMTAERGHDQLPVVLAQVHNTGGRALDLSGSLSLSQASGHLHAGPYGVQLGTTLAPGQTEPVRINIPEQLPDGPWNATLTLQSGLLLAEYQAKFSFPQGAGASAAAPARAAPSPGLPLWQIVLIGVAAAIIGTGVIVLGTLTVRRFQRRSGLKSS